MTLNLTHDNRTWWNIKRIASQLPKIVDGSLDDLAACKCIHVLTIIALMPAWEKKNKQNDRKRSSSVDSCARWFFFRDKEKNFHSLFFLSFVVDQSRVLNVKICQDFNREKNFLNFLLKCLNKLVIIEQSEKNLIILVIFQTIALKIKRDFKHFCFYYLFTIFARVLV